MPQRYKDLYRDMDVESLCAAPVVPPQGTRNGDYFRRSVRDYYACMTGVDEQVGRIVAELERAGLTERTLVIFTSDHGDCMGMHDHVGKNVCYDEAMRVPMILRWPGTIEARRDTTAMPAFADLGPTMLSLMGLEAYIPAEAETYDWARYVMKPGTAAPSAQQPYYLVQPARPETGMRGCARHAIRLPYAPTARVRPHTSFSTDNRPLAAPQRRRRLPPTSSHAYAATQGLASAYGRPFRPIGWKRKKIDPRYAYFSGCSYPLRLHFAGVPYDCRTLLPV